MSVELVNRVFNFPMKIAQLPYLTAVCQETLRIYPVVLFTFLELLYALLI